MKPTLRLSKDYLRCLSIFAILALNLGIALSYAVTWFSAVKQDFFLRADSSIAGDCRRQIQTLAMLVIGVWMVKALQDTAKIKELMQEIPPL